MSRPNDDPIACLKEIAELAMDRMNGDTEVTASEAFLLGQITGIAMRRPEVVEYLKAVEQTRQHTQPTKKEHHHE